MSDNPIVENSEEFEDAFHSGSGGLIRECHCGITTFNSAEPGFYDEVDDLPKLQNEAKKTPCDYREVDYSIGTMIVDGMEIVIGCPCNKGVKYERLILNNMRSIARFINKVIEIKRSEAQSLITIPQPEKS